MTLRIISPSETVFEGNVKSVTLPGEKGSFTVLNNHASLISTLVSGTIEYLDTDNQRSTVDIEGGLCDVDNNVISVCIFA